MQYVPDCSERLQFVGVYCSVAEQMRRAVYDCWEQAGRGVLPSMCTIWIEERGLVVSVASVFAVWFVAFCCSVVGCSWPIAGRVAVMDVRGVRIVKGCLYYDTCVAYMCAAHVRCTCVTYRMFPTTHMFVVHVWAWPLDNPVLQSDVTGCVIQLLSGVWYIEKLNAQVTAKFSSQVSIYNAISP